MKEASTRKKWVWRGAAAMLLVLAATAALPFVFPTATVRMVLARTPLKDLPLKFSGATLSPLGSVTLRDVVLEERRGRAAGRSVFAASAVQVDFNWGAVSSGKFRDIHVENGVVTLRKGEDVPLTLMDLFSPPPPHTAQPTTATNPASSPPPPAATLPEPANNGNAPVWFDRLSISGTVRMEGFDEWTHAASIPVSGLKLDAAITMGGERTAPQRGISLVLGDVEARTAAPVLVAKGRLQGTAAPVLVLEQCAVSNLSPAITRAMIERIPDLPGVLRQEWQGRLERLQIAGRIMFDREPTVSLTAEVRDVSLRGSGSELPLSVEHLNLGTRIEGKWTAGPSALLKDLLFRGTRLSWETLQAGEMRFSRGVADLQNDGMEVVLSDLQASVGDATLAATAAYDINAGSVARARLWLSNVDAARALNRLPANLRKNLPGTIHGNVAARLFMTELDAEHVAARVEVSSPEELTWYRTIREAATTATTPSLPATGPATTPTQKPTVTLANLNAGATVSWNMRTDALPEITRGRLTADRLDLVPPDGSAPQTAVRIISDFALSHGAARLNDLYANFADGANLFAEATYNLASHQLEKSKVTFSNVDASLINPWLPDEWNVGGKFNSEVQVVGNPSQMTLSASLELSPESSVQYGKVTIGITGASSATVPSPTMALKADADLQAGAWTIESFAPRGFGSIHMDAAGVQALRDLVNPDGGSAADQLLARIREGASVSFETLALSGKWNAGALPRATTTLQLAGLSLSAPASSGQEFGFSGLNLNGTVDAPLNAGWLDGLHIQGATLQAQRFAAGGIAVTNFTAALSAEGGKGLARDVGFTFGDGAFSGSAEFGLSPVPQVDGVELKFRALSQAVVTAALYPDRFTAEGPASGTLELRRTKKNDLAGSIVLDADSPGLLKISRETSESTFAQAAKAAASSEGALMPANFDSILVEELVNYPYATEHVELRDGARGLDVGLKYQRMPVKPGDPGYAVPVTVAGQVVKANLAFNLDHQTLTVNNSIAKLLLRMVELQDRIIPRAPGTAPATAPASAPSTAPATGRSN